MISNILFLIFTLLSVHLAHGSIASKKIMTPASSQKVTNNLEHPQLERDTLVHQAKKQVIEPMDKNPPPSPDSITETVSSENSNSTSTSSTMQHVPQPKHKIPVTKSSKKKRPDLLLDTTSVVEPVQLQNVSVVTQSTQVEKTIIQTKDKSSASSRMLSNDGEFSHFQLLINPPEIAASKSISFPPFVANFGDHVINFDFIHVSDALLLKLYMSNPPLGHIDLYLIKLAEPHVAGSEQDYSTLNHLNGFLNNGEILPLGTTEYMQHLARDGSYIYLEIDVSIAPGYYDAIRRNDLSRLMALKELQQISGNIKRLLDEEQYEEIMKFGNTMPGARFLRCLCPALTTFEQYEGLTDYLSSRDLLRDFFIHGDMEVVSGVMCWNDTYNSGEAMELALRSIFKNGLYERFIELMEVRRGGTMDDEPSEPEIEMPSFESFMLSFLEDLDPVRNSMAIKSFFVYSEGNREWPEVLESFSSMLIYKLHSQLHNPKAMEILDYTIGQPKLLTPTAFCYGFLYAPGEDDLDYDEDQDDSNYDEHMFNFLNKGWKEAIRVGLQGKYALGGKRLWGLMTGEFPDKFSGEFPQDEEALGAVLKHFPTKQELEVQWFKGYAEHFVRKVDEVISEIDPRMPVGTVISYLGFDGVYKKVSHSLFRMPTKSLTLSPYTQKTSNNLTDLELPVRYYLFDPAIPNDFINLKPRIDSHKDLFERVTECIKSTEKSCVVHLKFKNTNKSIKINSTSTEPLRASKDIFENILKDRISGISVLYVKTKEQTKPTSTDTPVPVKHVPRRKDIGLKKKAAVVKTLTPKEQERLRKDDDFKAELAKRRRLQHEKEMQRRKEAEEKERAELEKKRKEEKERRDANKKARKERLEKDPVPQKHPKTPKQTPKKSIVIQPNLGKKKKNGRWKNGKNKKDSVTLTIPPKNVPVPKKVVESLPPADPSMEPIYMNEEAMTLLSKFDENGRQENVILAREEGVDHAIEVMKSLLGELAITIESPSSDSNSFVSSIDSQQTSNDSTSESSDITLLSSDSNKKKKRRKNRKMKVKLHPDELQFLNLPTNKLPTQQSIHQAAETEFDEESTDLAVKNSLQEKNE